MNTLLPLAALVLANPQGDPPAALHCPAPLAAKGEAKGGQPLGHTFDLTHRGAGTLTVTKVETACGCLNQALTAHTLQPGGTAKFTMEVNTLTQPDGPNRWQVGLHYRVDLPAVAGSPPPAPQSGVLLLTISATLSREVSVTPPQVAFSCTGEASQVVTLTDRRAKPLTITKVHTTSAHLTATVGPRKDAAQTVVVRLAADAPNGHRDETVVLYTDDPAYPELRLPVRVLKRSANGVTATPADLSVRLAGKDDVSALVQLRTPDGKPVRIEAAESDHPGVTLKWSPAAAAVGAVRVTVNGAAEAGRGIVRVRFAEPAGHEVVVPVSWTAPAKK